MTITMRDVQRIKVQFSGYSPAEQMIVVLCEVIGRQQEALKVIERFPFPEEEVKKTAHAALLEDE